MCQESFEIEVNNNEKHNYYTIDEGRNGRLYNGQLVEKFNYISLVYILKLFKMYLVIIKKKKSFNITLVINLSFKT